MKLNLYLVIHLESLELTCCDGAHYCTDQIIICVIYFSDPTDVYIDDFVSNKIWKIHLLRLFICMAKGAISVVCLNKANFIDLFCEILTFLARGNVSIFVLFIS